MQNPVRTLLYGLFVTPILRVLQSILDGAGKASSVVRSSLKTNQRGVAPAKRVLPRDTRTHWERMNVVVPVYRLVSQGLSDREIAVRLSLTENTVYGCINYLVRRLKCQTRAELVLYASPKHDASWNIRSTPTMLISGMRRWRQRRLAESL